MHKWLISSRTMLINTSQQRNANQNHETPREGRKHVHTKTRTPVFTALLITARKWKQPSAHQGLYICCNHTMNIAWRWKGLKRWYTLQRERNAKTLHSSRGQKQQPTCSRIPFTWTSAEKWLQRSEGISKEKDKEAKIICVEDGGGMVMKEVMRSCSVLDTV